MSDNFEDDVDVEDAFDDFEESKPTLGSAWRDSPAFKFLVVGGAAVVIIGAITMFGGEEELPPQQDSYVPQAPVVKAAPGETEATPAYIEAIEEQNAQDLDKARASGGSVLPVPIDPPVGRIQDVDEEVETEDPLQRWRRLQEERLQKEIKQREELQDLSSSDVGAEKDAIEKLAGAMSGQMNKILGTKERFEVKTLNVTDAEFLKQLQEEEEEARNNANGGNQGEDDGFEEEIIQDTLLQAGEIVYAQLLTEANTDAPMPVLARVLSGPFAGAKLIGEFSENQELLTINFDRLVIGDDILNVSGMALDPETALPGMATDVDHHYLQRIVIPLAASFVEGLGDAIEETGSTTITINSSGGATGVEDTDKDTDEEIAAGVSELGSELGDIIDEMNDDLEVTVRIEAGTPIGVLFIEPVLSGETEL